MKDYDEIAELIENRKKESQKRSATEIFMYYQALVDAGFTKKQAIKIVVAVAGRAKG